MRLIYFSRQYSTHDHRFLSALIKAGHEPFFINLEKGKYPLEDRSLPPEVTQPNWAGGGASFKWQDAPRLVWDLRRLIRQLKPDLILAGPIQTAAFLVALTGFRSLVSMSWGYDLLLDAGRNRLFQAITRYTLRRSSAMVGDCATIRQRARDFGMEDARIFTFPWGVDLRHFSPEEKRPPTKQFTLISTRGWEPVYGVTLIAQAFVRASRRLQEESGVDLQLILLGDGSQASALRKIFNDGGVMGQVCFAGQVRQLDLPRFYRSADLYVSASHSDGSSISLLESQACGIPALVSDIPGNREWITPGVNGWCFADGDVDGLANGIVHAAGDIGRFSALSQAARSVAVERADWEKNFPQLFRAFDLAMKE